MSLSYPPDTANSGYTDLQALPLPSLAISDAFRSRASSGWKIDSVCWRLHRQSASADIPEAEEAIPLLWKRVTTIDVEFKLLEEREKLTSTPD